jgi:hypothetical protein
MMEAWPIYFEEFQRRGGSAHAQLMGRQQLLTEAAHDAYEAAANRLTQDHAWSDDHTLVVMRGLNAAVAQWLQQGGTDWEALRAELKRREDELKTGFGKPPVEPQ